MSDYVDTKHYDYNRHAKSWSLCRDCYEGESVIKDAGVVYLPQLEGQTEEDYKNYKLRAMFYGAVSRTVDALVGVVLKKEPTYAKKLKPEVLSGLTRTNQTFDDFLAMLLKEILITGRVGLLMDIDRSSDMKGQAYLAQYKAEDVVNWSYGEDGKLNMVVLREVYDVRLEDWFRVKQEERYRVLKLSYLDELADYPDQNNIDVVYRQEVYVKSESSGVGDTNKFVLIDTIFPIIEGSTLNYIPFWFIDQNGSTQLGRPPLVAMANVNISHYRNSADLEQGRHFTGSPQPWVSGVDSNSGLTMRIGSTVAWLLSNPNARAGYLEFTGQGLSSLKEGLEEKEKLMAVLGARLLEPPKKASESAENQKIRRQGESGLLSSIVKVVSASLSEAIRLALQVQRMQLPDDEAVVELHVDFTSMEADPQLLTALMTMLQSGTISYDSFFYNLQRMELYPKNTTVDSEIKGIESTLEKLTGLTTPPEPEPDDNDIEEDNEE